MNFRDEQNDAVQKMNKTIPKRANGPTCNRVGREPYRRCGEWCENAMCDCRTIFRCQG